MTTTTGISQADIEAHFAVLDKIGNLGKRKGFLRAAWSDEESAAMRYVQREAEAHGFQARYDRVGNLYIQSPDNKPHIIQVGSHLDTVPNGGNFDGAVGVIAGLEAIKALRDRPRKKGLELVVWRGEEAATYGGIYKGSSAAFGVADPKTLKNKFKGQKLEDAIRGQGFDPSLIREKKPAVTQEYIDQIAAHIELHIEQGRVLENANLDIGIVTSIRGPVRYRVELYGDFDHSGATPMNDRQDANLAMAHMHVALHELYKQHERLDLVQTVGRINVDPDKDYSHLPEPSVTKVCGFAMFSYEVRSNDNAFRDAYALEALDIIAQTAIKFKVKANIERIGESEALEQMDPVIQRAASYACQRLGHSYTKLPSGGGHDSAIVAKQQHTDGTNIPVGMLFIPCRNGKSHCPKEYTSFEAITKGANVVAETMYQLAK